MKNSEAFFLLCCILSSLIIVLPKISSIDNQYIKQFLLVEISLLIGWGILWILIPISDKRRENDKNRE